ncbi:MAG: AAA family ATPase [Phycisphaerae bacterium]|nr:AAA family ATPase [Phycisphaerae bacterium]
MPRQFDRGADPERASDDGAVAEIAGRLRTALGSQRYRLWFDGGARMRVDGSEVRVEATTQFVADWIGRNFRQELETAARAALGEQASVRLGVSGDPLPDRKGTYDDDIAARRVRARLSHAAGTTPAARPPTDAGAVMDAAPARRTEWRKLEDFVVGDGNRVAFDASRRVGESAPPEIHNLFLHGGVGLGKTHLLQGICQRRRERFPRERIRYTTGEQFTNEYVSSVRNGTLDAFRARMRRVDLLCIDDVHFIANKVATQNEFLHTLDAIDRVGRVVLASDEHPRQIRRVSEALLSRFMAGAVVRVDAPDRATRTAIAVRLAERRGMRLTPEAADAIAGTCVGSVREIEGAMARIAAHALVEGAAEAAISAALAARALREERTLRANGPLRPEEIVAQVSRRTGVDPGQLTDGSRHRRVVLARGLAVHLIRELTTLSYPEIARQFFGREGHSSALGADRRVRRQLERDESVPDLPGGPISLRELVDQLRHGLLRAPDGTMAR